MNLFAKFVSLVSSPILISAPLSYALIYKTSGSVVYSLQWTFLSLFFASIVALFVFYGVMRGFFSDFDVSKRNQRTPLFLFTGTVSVAYFVLVILLNGPRIVLLSIAALILGVLISEIINTKIKASMHLAVFTSFAMIAGILYGGIFWVFLFLAPVVAWSRIKLKRHSLPETIAGSAIGISLVLLIFSVVKYVIGV